MTTLRSDDYDALTFDCYGTLVDWGSGIVGCLRPLLLERDIHASDDFLLDFFAATEPQVQAEGGCYADVLREVLRRLGKRLGFAPGKDALNGFADSVAAWPLFDDTAEALQRLARRFDLVVVSNIDNAIFAQTAPQLGVEFKHVVTAQDVGAYKPDRRMFDAALAAIGDARPLHVAQSLFHDIAPANALGLDTVWIKRNHGAARSADATPTWSFDTLADFAAAVAAQ